MPVLFELLVIVPAMNTSTVLITHDVAHNNTAIRTYHAACNKCQSATNTYNLDVGEFANSIYIIHVFIY